MEVLLRWMKSIKDKTKEQAVTQFKHPTCCFVEWWQSTFFFSYKRSKTLLRFQRTAVKNDVWLKPNARELKWPTVKVESTDTFNMFNFCILYPLQMGIDVFLALSHANDS